MKSMWVSLLGAQQGKAVWSSTSEVSLHGLVPFPMLFRFSIFRSIYKAFSIRSTLVHIILSCFHTCPLLTLFHPVIRMLFLKQCSCYLLAEKIFSVHPLLLKTKAKDVNMTPQDSWSDPVYTHFTLPVPSNSFLGP